MESTLAAEALGIPEGNTKNDITYLIQGLMLLAECNTCMYIFMDEIQGHVMILDCQRNISSKEALARQLILLG
jgi:hypothetical protein